MIFSIVKFMMLTLFLKNNLIFFGALNDNDIFDIILISYIKLNLFTSFLNINQHLGKQL